MIAIAAAARAQDTTEYTVREGDTCASIARRYFDDSQRHDRLHALNPQLGPPPHHLVAGTVLRVPSAIDDAEARITGLENRVLARGEGASFAPASRGLALARGHQVMTEEASSAELTFRDRSRLAMRERTLVIVYGATRSDARTIARTTLERGALRSRLAELAGEVEIETPGGQARASGEVLVSVDAEGTSRVANQGEGSASLGGVDLPAGTGVVAQRGQTPSAPRPLPQPPRWSVDNAGRFVGLTGHGATLRFGFEPVRDARSYRVEISRAADGSDVVAAVEIGGGEREVVLHRIPAGTYYVSIATIDEHLLEGRASPRRALTVLEASLIPLDGGVPRVEPFDFGDPSVPYESPRLWPGTWIVAPRGLRCDAGDGALSGMSTLAGAAGSDVVVRCVDARDREVPAFEVRVASARIEGTLPAIHRERRETIPIALVADAPLPERLTAHAEGFDARWARSGDGYVLGVYAPFEAPEAAHVELFVATGSTRVVLATFELPVASEQTIPRGPAPITPPAPRPSELPIVQTALGAVPLAGTIGLREGPIVRVHLRGGAGALDPDDADLRSRGVLGVDVPVPGEPLALGFAWMLDAGDPPARDATRGSGDLFVRGALALLRGTPISAQLELAAQLPTGGAASSLGRARLAPSILGRLDLAMLTLRTQHGALIDREGAAYSSAIAADVRPLPWLAVGAQLDLAVGAELGVAVALGVAARMGAVDLSLGARFAPREGDAFPRWSGALGVAARLP